MWLPSYYVVHPTTSVCQVVECVEADYDLLPSYIVPVYVAEDVHVSMILMHDGFLSRPVCIFAHVLFSL